MTIISSGQSGTLSSGQTLSGTIVLSGGSLIVASGGAAIGTVVSNGGTEVVSSGTTRNTVISSGGQQVISDGGTASATMIGSGGGELVRSGGALSGATISGGTLEVASGGAALSSTITFAGGGSLVLDDTKFRGKIAGFAVPDTIDLTAVSFGSSTTLGYAGNALSGTLTVTDGLQTVKLAMLGHYGAGSLSLAADGHGGTLVADPPLSSGSLASPH